MFGTFPTIQFRDEGFLNLAGTSQVDDHVFNANLFWTPAKNLTVLGGFRFTHENKDSDAVHLATNTNAARQLLPPEVEAADTWEDFNNFAQRLEVRYTGIANWLFYAEGEWEEECGNVQEHEVAGGVDEGMLDKDTSLLAQKYTIGANWYATPRLAFSGQYDYRIADYDNDINSDLTGANQRLLSQDWSTNNFNIRITFRPPIPASLGTISLVTRYDFNQTLVHDSWFVVATATALDDAHTALISSHVNRRDDYLEPNRPPLPSGDHFLCPG